VRTKGAQRDSEKAESGGDSKEERGHHGEKCEYRIPKQFSNKEKLNDRNKSYAPSVAFRIFLPLLITIVSGFELRISSL
jgi:hypothetical protein